jgi:hypothetical protein
LFKNWKPEFIAQEDPKPKGKPQNNLDYNIKIFAYE